MIGPGKYDKLCTLVRERAKATGAIVIVFDGAAGQGFSCQLPITFDGPKVAAVLRHVASEIERTYPGVPGIGQA